ncbi:MAG: methylase [Anaerolineaceae bacterium]
MPNPSRRPDRPVGQITRGKTARNRLRRVDIFTLLYARELLTCAAPDARRAFFVDLGYGAEAFTTLESAERFRALNPHLDVLGVEIDPARIAAALPYADENTLFRLGGFNVPLETGETVRLIRAFNVLRQYAESEVAESHAMMGASLMPGGLIIEGTSNPSGRVWVANLLRKGADAALRMEGLVFGTNFHGGFEPGIFQPVLPKNYIHRMEAGETIYEFMEAWKAASRQTIAHKAFGLRQWFAASARQLAAEEYTVDTRRKLLRLGILLWRFDG